MLALIAGLFAIGMGYVSMCDGVISGGNDAADPEPALADGSADR